MLATLRTRHELRSQLARPPGQFRQPDVAVREQLHPPCMARAGSARRRRARRSRASPATARCISRVDERSRYTTTLRLTYVFDDAGAPLADPDLQIRVYHDARLAEVQACARWHRHAMLESMRSHLARELGDRWLRNVMLNKWLDYCVERGHRFRGPAAPLSAPPAPPSRPAPANMAISDRLSNIRQLLPGARQPERGRAAVAAVTGIAPSSRRSCRGCRTSVIKPLEQIRNQETATARAKEQLEVLEEYLGNPEMRRACARVLSAARAVAHGGARELARFAEQLQAAADGSRASPSADRVRPDPSPRARRISIDAFTTRARAPTCWKRS